MAGDDYEHGPDYKEDGDGANGGDDESASSKEENGQVQGDPPKITSDHWREEQIMIHPSMIPVFTAYDDSSVLFEGHDEISLTAFKPSVNHNVAQSQLCAEMTNNFLGEVYKSSESHTCSLNNDMMHAVWGQFVSSCVGFHVAEFAIFVFILACDEVDVLQTCQQRLRPYMSGRLPDKYVWKNSS